MSKPSKSAGVRLVPGRTSQPGNPATSKADAPTAGVGADARSPSVVASATIPVSASRALSGLLAMLRGAALLIDAVTGETAPLARRRALCRDLAAKAIEAGEALEDAANADAPDWQAVRLLAEETEQLVSVLATLHDNLVDGETSALRCDGLLAVAIDVAGKLAGELYTEPVRATKVPA